MGVELVAKRVELLHEILPGATRIALLVNPNNPGLMQDNIQLSTAAVKQIGLEMIVIEAGSGAISKPRSLLPWSSRPRL